MDRGRPPLVSRSKWERVAEMCASGKKSKEIGDALGVSRQAVDATLRTDEVKEMVEAIHAETREAVTHRLQATATLGLDVLEELARGRPVKGRPTVHDTVRRQAASDLLDRCGVTTETALRVEGDAGPRIVIDAASLAQLSDHEIDAAEHALTETTE